ncbi:dihydrofolate reductase [endosymbiont GvMRE of Glomus versiforme]
MSSEIKYFSQIASNGIVLMESKNFESIDKLLKSRFNIVINS